MGVKKKVVALPFPMQGHITPLLQLCYQLAASGIDITFVNTDRNHERLVGRTSSVSKLCESSGTITFVAISVPNNFEGGPNKSLNAALVAADAIAEPFEKLLSELGDEIICLISDGYLGWTQEAANKFAIPRVALWTSNVAYILVNYHLPALIENGYASRKENSSFRFDDDHVVRCVPGLDPIHPRDLPSVIHFESKEDPGFANRIGKLCALKQASWVLVNSFEEIEQAGVEAMKEALGTDKFVTIGPLLNLQTENRKSLWKEDLTCLDWLDKQKSGSVLYVSFGSLAVMSGDQVERFAKGLEDIRQSFLWVMRPGFVSGSSAEEFQKFEDRARKEGRGMVVEWAPQIEVLQHSAIGGHLSHCGWNSVQESMMMGVPILGWPCIAEQTMNCKRIVADWGIGLTFRKDEDDELVSDCEVGRVVRKLFWGEEGVTIRKRAKEFSMMVRNALEIGGSSHRNLKTFVEAVSCSNL